MGFDHKEEIYQCYALGGRLNFQTNGISICHSLECEDPFAEFDYSGTANIADVYSALVDKTLAEVQAGKKCRNCSMLKRQHHENILIKIITLNINTQCNCRCLYCCSHICNMEKCVNIISYLKQLDDKKLISADCFFDYGGGEPTIDPYFPETLDYITEKKYFIRVNTNAVRYSNILKNYMSKYSDINVRVSIDAGTDHTYLRIKGIDRFFDVWNNIKKYREASENIILKYVITKYNTSETDLLGFINMCVHCGISKVIVDIDHDAYTGKDIYGWADYTREMLKAANALINMAEKKGISAYVGYVWTAGNVEQNSYDYNLVQRDPEGHRIATSGAQILLPPNYVPSRKKAKITYDKYNNIKEMCRELKGKDVFLYGAGYFGQRMYDLIHQDVNIIGFVDLNLGGQSCKGKKVIFPQELQNLSAVNIVITSSCCEDIMRFINEQELLHLENHIYFMTRTDFDYYENKD